MADVTPQTEDWQTLPWAQFQRNVYRLQKRIYGGKEHRSAQRRGDTSTGSVHASSASAICNGYCFGRDRHDIWPCGKSRRTTAVNAQPV